MTKFYFITLSVFLSFQSFAAPVIKATSNGFWNESSNWDLNRLPTTGDTIVIPAGKMITINDDQLISGFVYIKVYGKLNFQNNNSTLRLGNTAVVMVYNEGQLVGGGTASQKLRIGNNTVFTGNEAPVYGPQVANINTDGFDPVFGAILPVKFAGFSVSRKNNKDVLVQWSTAEEVNAYMFEVERSFDGAAWNTIAYVSAVGNSKALVNYSFTDKNVNARVAYYRIKQVDVESRAYFTDARSIKSDFINTANINIASSQGNIFLQFPHQVEGNVMVRIININGQVMEQQVIDQPVGQVMLQSRTNLKGNYIVNISNGREINLAGKVIL
ncbi:MAG TPA: G8 domain-containing protein [Flavisolibacter sp.]